MKKLIIAAAIVCAAVIAQAATANWGVGASNIYVGDGSTTKIAQGATVYMFDAGITSQAALYALFAADTAMDMTTAAGYAGTVATSAAGVMAATKVKFSYGDQSTVDSSNAYDFYFAIIDGDNIYLSDSKSVVAGGSDTAVSISFGSQATGSKLPAVDGFQGAGAWSAVPEPTSGLLMLVGLAGLALRRRRA
jgi:hypothetical protein